MTQQELLARIREYKEYKQLLDETQQTIDGIADEIKAHMNAQGIDEMTVDVFKVRYQEVKSNRFDTTAFKTTHSDLYNQYAKESTTRRFTVT